MPIKQLNDEQVATWTRLEKDKWWFERLLAATCRSSRSARRVTGFLLGGILSATALYIAGKTGITIGVGLTSVILAFAMFRIMSRTGMIEDFTILENNCTQSIATAAGYMVTPMVAGTGRLHDGHGDHRAVVAVDDLQRRHLDASACWSRFR